jgi:hypothetical protein
MRGSTADEIGRGLAHLDVHGPTPVAPGDVFVSCVDQARDLWVSFPIARVTASGVVTHVVDGDGAVVPWHAVSALVTTFGIPAAMLDAEKLPALMHRKFSGAARAGEAFRAILRRRQP